LLGFTLSACDDSTAGDDNEGLIEFNTSGVDVNHPLYGYAPSNATMKFKAEKFSIEMSTMGMFNTAIIGDNNKMTIAQVIKFLDIKQACIEHEQEIRADNAEYGIKIEETQETKNMLGFTCYKAKVTKIKDPNVTFDVWYTKEIGDTNCNALTPYAQLKGMLLDYRIQKFGMELHFTAKSYRNIRIPENTFEIPHSVKIVTPEEMENFFANI
jgi:hypothetical protein